MALTEAHKFLPAATLKLNRASVSRPSGEWNDDDYDVLADGVVVGRIMGGRPGAGMSGAGQAE
jgi:hypothetical protein